MTFSTTTSAYYAILEVYFASWPGYVPTRIPARTLRSRFLPAVHGAEMYVALGTTKGTLTTADALALRDACRPRKRRRS